MLDLKLEYEYMKEDIDFAIKKCLEHQKWILGPEVKEFEDKVAEYLNVRHCIGISSGTDALVLSLRALALKTKGEEYWDRDDLIIATSFTFTATGDAILRAGATPLFVDIDPASCNINPEEILSALSSIPSTSNVVGILPVHLYGQSCNMDEIMDIAKEYNLFIVEDVAQAFGGMWKDKKLGSIGIVGAFSFFPSKNLGGFGDGGMVSTNDDEIAGLVRMLLRHGGKDKYNVDHIGYNARLDTFQAAIILAKLKYLDEFNERRRKIARIYNKELSEINDISLPDAINSPHIINNYHVYHQYSIKVLDGRRDELQTHLKENGISTMIYYPFTLHNMKVFENGRCKVSGQLRNAELATQRVLSLPIEPLQRMVDTAYVIDCLKRFFENKLY